MLVKRSGYQGWFEICSVMKIPKKYLVSLWSLLREVCQKLEKQRGLDEATSPNRGSPNRLLSSISPQSSVGTSFENFEEENIVSTKKTKNPFKDFRKKPSPFSLNLIRSKKSSEKLGIVFVHNYSKIWHLILNFKDIFVKSICKVYSKIILPIKSKQNIFRYLIL